MLLTEPPLLKLSGILPFGVNVSVVPGPRGDDSSSKPLTLRVPFPFFGKEYTKIIVSLNEVLVVSSVAYHIAGNFHIIIIIGDLTSGLIFIVS